MSNATLKVRFFCFHCYEPVSAPAEHVGKQGQCPRCGKLTAIPPTSTRGPNRAALAKKSMAREADEVLAAAQKEGATLAPAERGELLLTRTASVPAAVVNDGFDEDGPPRESTNGAPAPGPAPPRPVVEHQKIEVWKEVFRGKPQ